MVVVGILSAGDVHPLFMKSLRQATRGVSAEEVYRFHINTCSARNEIVKVAINSGADHIFFADTDMVFPPDTLSRLLAHDRDIIGGYYHRKCTGFASNAFDFTPNGSITPRFYPKAGVERVAALGTGCLLIRTSVFKRLSMPYFNYALDPRGERLMTEDVVFCDEARKVGFDIYLDTSIRCGHIGEFIVTPNDDTETVRIQPVR